MRFELLIRQLCGRNSLLNFTFNKQLDYKVFFYCVPVNEVPVYTLENRTVREKSSRGEASE